MTGLLAERRIVVTGAGRGLGRAVALGLAREGASLTICDRTVAELDAAECELREAGANVSAHRLDLADAAACERFVIDVVEGEGPVDVLVNNAGVLFRAPLVELTTDTWQQTLAVNLTAPMILSRGFLPGMLERGGSIVHLSSRAGALGFVGETAYCASKFGVEGLTKAMAAELAGTAVSVNSITPGLHIKPTMMTIEDEAQLPDAERPWRDAAALVPAFVLLARARGAPSGLRFDAQRLAAAVERGGYDLPEELLEELSE